jgi:anti-sigma factor RsiW
MQDWIDGDLDPAQSAALDEHIASCLSCDARLRPLLAVDAALSSGFSQATLDESFDRKVLERIASAANADRVAARARIETDRQDQMAALSHRWRNAWKSMVLNALAGVALLIALSKSLGFLPFVPRLIDQIPLLTQYTSIHPATLLPAAAGLTVMALWLVRSLASTER